MGHKKICSVCIATFMLASLALTACKEATNEKEYEQLDIWSTYNTVKVLRDSSDYPHLGQKLDVSMAKGEREGGQVIVNPKGGNIQDISVATADLKSESGATFSKDNVTVYLQKYIYVETKTLNQENMEYPIGYTPDMLLEQSIADEYNENSVKENQNQGITIEFQTTSETEAGTYTGMFQVVADGKNFALPVTLTVWDIDITEVQGKTYVDYTGVNWMTGEYDTSPEKYRRYFEKAMNEYKFMLDVPGWKIPTSFTDSVMYYWDNPNFTGYNIPLKHMLYPFSKIVDKGLFYDYIMELAKASTPEKLLFEKAYIVAGNTDEVRQEDYQTVYDTLELIYDVEDRVFEDLEESGYFDQYDAEYKERFLEEIRGISIIQTVDADQVKFFGTDVNTYCPYLSFLENSAMLDIMRKAAEENDDRGGDLWFYTCMNPKYPYPSHHIDDYLLGSRVMRWMQKDYDVTGYLYWSIFYYNKFDSGHVQTDPYEEALRFAGVNGDGFMAYPGKKYGLDNFIPSIRMTTFRDGQEDYDLLCALDKEVEKKEAFYGLPVGEISAATQLTEYYEQLFTGTVYEPNDELFYSVRRQVVDVILSQEGQANYLLQTDVNKQRALANIYVAEGYSVKVNDTLVSGQPSGQGYKYTVEQPRTQDAKLNIEILKDGAVVESYYVFLAAKSVDVTLTEDSVYLSTDSTVTKTEDGLAVTLCSWGESSRDKLSFVPSVGFTASALGNLTEVSKVMFEVTNTSDEEISFGIRFKSGSFAYVVYNTNIYKLAVGESVTIEINNVYQYENSFSRLSTATLEIFMDNLDENDEKYGARTFVVSQLSYDGKGA